MPGRLPRTETESRARRRAAAPSRASEAETLALFERAAIVRDGLALVEQAPLEFAAVLLGVEPRAVERVRAALDDLALRDEAIRRFVRAAEDPRPLPAAPAPALAPRDPEALLRAARSRSDGLALLLDAAPEAAAIVFGVHPELVLRTRAAARAGDPGPGSASAP